MKKLSSVLKDQVRSWCNDVEATSPLIRLGREGKLTEARVASYVANLEHLFRENIQTISEAVGVYADSPVISAYFQRKWLEERGHDDWARSDLMKLKGGAPEVLPEMKSLTSFLRETMKSDPLCYIAYFYHAEYSTEILGPLWLELIELSTGVGKNRVTSLSRHVELDGDHAHEVGAFLDSLSLTELEVQRICEFGRVLQSKYESFYLALSEHTHGRRTVTTKISA